MNNNIMNNKPALNKAIKTIFYPHYLYKLLRFKSLLLNFRNQFEGAINWFMEMDNTAMTAYFDGGDNTALLETVTQVSEIRELMAVMLADINYLDDELNFVKDLIPSEDDNVHLKMENVHSLDPEPHSPTYLILIDYLNNEADYGAVLEGSFGDWQSIWNAIIAEFTVYQSLVIGDKPAMILQVMAQQLTIANLIQAFHDSFDNIELEDHLTTLILRVAEYMNYSFYDATEA